jgi:hypothetical protein
VDHALNLLAVEVQPFEQTVLNFRDYEAAFAADDERFYDEYGKKNAWHQRILDLANNAPRERDEARQALEAAQAALTASEQALTAARQEAERHRARADEVAARARAIEASTAWRLTAPLRGVIGVLKGRG